MSKPSPMKAITAGTIFGGLVDVYRLEDGTVTISGRGAVRALTAAKDGKNAGRDSGDIRGYVNKLPNEYRDMAVGATAFEMPQGGLAKGIAPATFVDILTAYSDADDRELLHPSQVRLARNANRLLRALASVGIQKMCEEAVGVVRPNAEDWFVSFMRDGLRKVPATDSIWPPRFVSQYCRWNGIAWKEGQRHPFSMQSANGFFYSMIFPTEVVRIIREKGLDAGCKHHQTLTNKPRGYLSAQLDVSVAIAQSSISEKQWRRRMLAFYGKDKNTGWDFE